ncbi:fasciclin domain-containing protein [Paracoccaceae bacterium GXU_MW_L88]
MKRFVLPLGLLVALPVTAQTAIEGEEVFPERNIAENIVTVETLSRFVEGATATGLIEELRAEGPVTLIAPKDDAFPPLEEDAPSAAEILTEDGAEAFTDLIGCHIIPMQLATADFSSVGESTVETLGSCELTMRGGQLFGPDGAEISLIETDIAQENGVLHLTDDLIEPVE